MKTVEGYCIVDTDKGVSVSKKTKQRIKNVQDFSGSC